MYRSYHAPTTLEGALALKAEYAASARVIAGGTDLLIEIDRGQRRADDGGELHLIDLTRIPGLAQIRAEDGEIYLGPLVTHNQCVASDLIVERAFPLARACWEVGAPQIRNRATIAGNIITASPANDSIVPLLALDARVTLASVTRGERTLSLADFVLDFRSVDLAADEILVGIRLRPMAANEQGGFIKLGLRRVQAISVLSVAALVAVEDGLITRARIALGAVAPTVVRATAAEAALVGQPFTAEMCRRGAELALEAASPIDDIRGSAEYREAMVETLVARLLEQLRRGEARSGWLADPVMLWGDTGGVWPVQGRAPVEQTEPATAMVNGQSVHLAGRQTLLHSLRDAGFVGVKEGCAEGECGACTVFVDGMAVMACLVPAERAAGSHVVTVEGLGQPGQMHPVQAALVQSGGVQCGYCTPGFVLSAAKLLEEKSAPNRAQVGEAFAGNLCRCTGYRKIIDAVVAASVTQTHSA